MTASTQAGKDTDPSLEAQHCTREGCKAKSSPVCYDSDKNPFCSYKCLNEHKEANKVAGAWGAPSFT